MQQLVPQLFGGFDLEAAPQPVFRELRHAHGNLMETHAHVSDVYLQMDATYHDDDKDGEGHTQYHLPTGLAKNKELLPLSRFGTEDEYLQSAHSGATCTPR